MSGNKVSLLIVAHNEESQIADCIGSGKFADEIVVVLDRSTDRTGAIAEQFGAKLIIGDWPNEGDRRSQGISACTGAGTTTDELSLEDGRFLFTSKAKSLPSNRNS